MIKFLIVLSIVWGLVSVLGWIGLVARVRACSSVAAKEKVISRIYWWSVALDLLAVSFWIWLVIR